MESAREALRAGVYDYLTKPVDHRELSVVVKHALEHERLMRENRELNRAKAAREARGRLIGSSTSFQRTLRFVEEAAPTGSSLLLLGESGTGKERVAELVHAMSPRAAGPWVTVNCAAIPEPLLEAELFGHEEGAFTDARMRQAGAVRRKPTAGPSFSTRSASWPRPSCRPSCLRALQEQVRSARLGSDQQGRARSTSAWSRRPTGIWKPMMRRGHVSRGSVLPAQRDLQLDLPPLAAPRGPTIFCRSLAEYFLASGDSTTQDPPSRIAG